MEDKQKAWIAQVVGKKAEREQVRQIENRRDAIRQSVVQQVDEISGQLFSDMNLKVSDGKQEQRLLSPLRDQREEFDLDDQQDGFMLITPEDEAKHHNAADTVTRLSRSFDETIEVVAYDEDGRPIEDPPGTVKKVTKPLFDPGELGAEFYQPLLRQGLMAETFVPDEFSETQEMMEESFKAYAKRLEETYEASSVKRFFKENKSLMLTTATSTITLVGQGIKADGIANFDMEDALDSAKDPLSWGKDFAKGNSDPVAEMASFGWDIVSGKALDAKDDIGELIGGRGETREAKARSRRPAEIRRACELAVAIIAARLGAALTPWNLEMTAPSIYSSSVSRDAMAVALAAEPPAEKHVAQAVAEAAGAFKKAFRVCDPQFGDSAATIARATTAAKDAFGQAVDAGAIVEALAPGEEDYAAVLGAFDAAAAAAMQAMTGDKDFTDLLDGGKDAILEKASKAMVDDFVEQSRKAEQDEKDAAVLEFAAMQNEKDDERRAALIDQKIARLQRDQKLLKWSTGLVGMGFDVASKFLAPMAIGGSALKLAVDIGKAAARTRDFLNFVESQGDMFRAASPYSAPLDSFIDNAALQMLHYEMVAALELVIMIGAIVETVGMASGMGAAAGVVAGKTLQAMGAGGQAIEAVLYEIKKRYDLEASWKLYKTALLRPANRKLALKAMAGNPTLAKYSVAWGAVIKKDALVGDFMKSCGLDSATLKDPGSSLDKVQQYLEARMPDDNVVEGRMPVSNDWEPAALALTAASWTAMIRRAVKSAELIETDTSAIEQAFSMYEIGDAQRALTLKQGLALDLPAKQAANRQLQALQNAFNAYKPRRKAGKDKDIGHDQVNAVVERYRKLMEAARESVALDGGWEKAPVELSGSSWTRILQRATVGAGLLKADTAAVGAALAAYGEGKRQREAGRANGGTIDEAAKASGLRQVDALEQALAAYQPRRLNTDGKPVEHVEMKAVVQKFVDQLAQARMEVNA